MITSKDIQHLRHALAIALIYSKDPTTKTGALVLGDLPKEIAIGYNGFPPGIADTEDRLLDRALKNQLTRHAEENAISNVRGFIPRVIYATHYPCADKCALGILAARTIRRVVTVASAGEFADRWGESCARSAALFREAGITVDVLEQRHLVFNQVSIGL